MEGFGEENLFMQHSLAVWQKIATMQEEYLKNVRRMLMNGMLWSDLAIKITETGFNAYMSKTARWSDAGNIYQDNLLKTLQPAAKGKID